jgi:UDP-N-acetyl-D-glucosamine/UDP-N-acetyl-D-galactosamine dehydrogenase
LNEKNISLAIIGLGYVGLPLAAEFGKKYSTLGFDIDRQRIKSLNASQDNADEVDSLVVETSPLLTLSADREELRNCNVFIVTVPTPVDTENRPNLGALKNASQIVGESLKQGATVIYESTVFPGATEEVCVPIIERFSGLKLNEGFSVGYSPERINPGDSAHTLTNIMKITSGSNPAAAEFVDALYASIITAGTYRAESIKVAEAAKVIENTQRDVNIALVNEFAVIFHHLGIDTKEVLDAAGTKWNFLPFSPGLVGGHCIGVDPYYLTYRAERAGYKPEVILAGRKRNDSMGKFLVDRIIKMMIHRDIKIRNSNILVLGVAFKENCADLRNSRVVDIVREFETFEARMDIVDPHVDPAQAKEVYGLEVLKSIPAQKYQAIVLAVAHNEFVELKPEQLSVLRDTECVVFDIKGSLPQDSVDGRL